MMLFAQALPHVDQQDVFRFSKVVSLALATLIPAVVTAAVKWVQDRSRFTRSTQLTERISALSKSIAELPEVTLTGALGTVTPRSALTAELETALKELNNLQKKTARSLSGVYSTTTSTLRAALLLYRPKGFGALLLHVAFYLYSFLLILLAVSLVTQKDTFDKTSTGAFVIDIALFFFFFGVLGIPSAIMRYFAHKIHLAQLKREQDAATAVQTSPLASSAAS